MPTLRRKEKQHMAGVPGAGRIDASRLFLLSAMACFKRITGAGLVLLWVWGFAMGSAKAQWGLTLGGLENEGAVAMAQTPEDGYMVLGFT